MKTDQCVISEFIDEDIKRVLEIEQQNLHEQWNVITFNFFRSTHICDFFVAKINEEIVGFIMSVIENKLSSEGFKIIEVGHIVNLAIDKNFKRKGIGYNLIRVIIDKLKKRHVTKVYLEARRSNKAAIKLYIKSGFKIESIRKSYYNNNEDAYIMTKLINEKEV